MLRTTTEIPLSQVEAHGNAPIRRLEFHMSYVCDQACTFCSESVRMATFEKSPISYGNIVKTLIRKRKDGCDHVTFTGGEPTLHPQFIDILRAAKRLGFKTYATSDGQRFASRAFADDALPLLDELCLSIHGHSASVHDPLVKKPGSFERLMTAIAMITRASKKPYLLTNTVMTRDSISHLPDTIGFLAAHPAVRHCTVSNLAPDGDALKDYGNLAVRLDEIEKVVPLVAESGRRFGKVIRFFGVPMCKLQGNWDLPNDLHWTPRVTVERGMVGDKVGLQEIFSANPGRMRFFAPICEGCTARSKCWGIFKTYYEQFGANELSPIRTE